MKKKESNWFPLDCLDEKEPGIIAMCSAYKMEGYGRWLKLLEILRIEEDYKYNLNAPCSYKVIASRLMITEAKAKKFLDDLLHVFQLLETDGEYIWSPMLNEKMEYWENRKSVLSERGKKGAANMHAKRVAQADDSFGTSKVLLDNNDGTSIVVLCKEMAQDNTVHNNTEQNTTTTTTEERQNEAVVVNPSSQTISNNWEQHKTTALADDRFVYPLVTARKISKEELGCWIGAFNRILGYRNEPQKTDTEYRKHFGHWFKFRNLDKETPDTVSAVPAPVRPPTQANAIDPLAYLKSPAEVQADLDRHNAEWKKKRKASPNPSADFNQFDLLA